MALFHEVQNFALFAIRSKFAKLFAARTRN